MWNVKIKFIIRKIIAIWKVKALPKNHYKPFSHEKQSNEYRKLSSHTKETNLENGGKCRKLGISFHIYVSTTGFCLLCANLQLHLSWLNRTMINRNLN